MKIVIKCPICLMVNGRMIPIKNTELQVIYRKLIEPVKPEDVIPETVCYMCFGRLRNTHVLMLDCIKAEHSYTEMLDVNNKQVPKTDALKDRPQKLSIGTINNMDINPVKCESIEIKEEEDYEVREVMEGINTSNECMSKSRRNDNHMAINDKTMMLQEAPKYKYEILCTNNNDGQISSKTEINDDSHNTIMDVNYKVTTDSNENNILENMYQEQEYDCDVCHKSFDEPSVLKQHARTHTGERPHKCDFCHSAFAQRGNLISHLRIHTGDKPFKCITCQKYFTEMGHLKKHMKIHLGERLFHCDACQKEFLRRDTLIIHIKRAHSAKQYKCGRCQKSFTSSYELEEHSMIHKKHKCEICQQTFTWHSNLLRHASVHTGRDTEGKVVVHNKYNKCDICHKTFTMHSSLVKHVSIHTGEKPHKCDICHKSFRRHDGLLSHRRKHTGDNHKCTACHRSYVRSCDLKRHLLKCAKAKRPSGRPKKNTDVVLS